MAWPIVPLFLGIALSYEWNRKVVDDTCWLSTEKPLQQFKNEHKETSKCDAGVLLNYENVC